MVTIVPSVLDTVVHVFPFASEKLIVNAGVIEPVVVTTPLADQTFPFPAILRGRLLFTPLIDTVTPVSDSLPVKLRLILSPAIATDPLLVLFDSICTAVKNGLKSNDVKWLVSKKQS
jgi:hypothetical protein